MVDRRRCIAGRRCAYPGRMPVTVETTPPAEADEPAIPVEAGEQMPEEDSHFPGDPFFELGLAPSIVDDIAAQGLTEPTPIQQEAIPAILAGHDLIGLAQTGTGKTAAYLLPLLNKLLDKRKANEVRRTSVLILAPTRELAYQISDSIKAFSGSFKVRYITICGGERYDFQIRSLNKGVDVIVATPGRFEDLQARGKVKLDDIEHFVLDEGDQMIDLGFYPAIKRIFETLPSTCQTVFFSATMPKEMETLAESFLKDAVTIRAARAGETVDHRAVRCSGQGHGQARCATPGAAKARWRAGVGLCADTRPYRGPRRLVGRAGAERRHAAWRHAPGDQAEGASQIQAR